MAQSETYSIRWDKYRKKQEDKQVDEITTLKEQLAKAHDAGWNEALMEAKTAILLSGCKDGSIHTEAIRRLKIGQGA